MPVLHQVICMVCGREGPGVEFKVREGGGGGGGCRWAGGGGGGGGGFWGGGGWATLGLGVCV